MYGIRIITKSSGIGNNISMGNILIELSSAIALIFAARSITDAIMSYLYPERVHYKSRRELKGVRKTKLQ